MKVNVLFLHRKESYPGEHAPEVIAVCDEFTHDENPEWWPSEKAKAARVHTDAAAWADIVIDLPTDTIMAALYPQPVVVPATIVAVNPEHEPA